MGGYGRCICDVAAMRSEDAGLIVRTGESWDREIFANVQHYYWHYKESD